MISASEFVNRESERILTFKHQAERTMLGEIRSHFADVKRSLFDPPSIRPVIDRHYRRVVARLLSTTMKQEEVDRQSWREEIVAALASRAFKDAELANSTTKKDIQAALAAARKELGPEASDQQVNATAARIFRRMAAGREALIATTETQAATEHARDEIARRTHDAMTDAIEEGDRERVEALAGLSGDYASLQAADRVAQGDAPESVIMGLAMARKMWKDMDDSRVRPWHAAADRQKVPVNEPFIVMGEQLMFPGDTSRGASMKNVANCRCISMHV